jgi:hypothetical protein
VREYEFPGVYVEEVEGKSKPIDGVPTDDGEALTWADGPSFVRVIALGAAVLAGLAIWLAMTWGNVTLELFFLPGGAESALALLGCALLLNALRALVEWRRRKAGRPPLRYGNVALGLAAFVLATSVAFGLCLLVWAASLLVTPDLSPDFLTAGLTVVVGSFLIRLIGGSVRDLLLLVQAARNDP